MNITLHRKNKAVHFEAVNSLGNTIQIDGPESIGGEGKGMRPMEILLTSVAGCSSFDLVEILKKQKEPLEDVRIEISGNRKSEGDVKPFTDIELVFTLKGDLNEKKVARAVQLAVEKYCSVAASLDPAITVTHRFEIIHP